jgi:hypothetical protein
MLISGAMKRGRAVLTTFLDPRSRTPKKWLRLRVQLSAALIISISFLVVFQLRIVML